MSWYKVIPDYPPDFFFRKDFNFIKILNMFPFPDTLQKPAGKQEFSFTEEWKYWGKLGKWYSMFRNWKLLFSTLFLPQNSGFWKSILEDVLQSLQPVNLQPLKLSLKWAQFFIPGNIFDYSYIYLWNAGLEAWSFINGGLTSYYFVSVSWLSSSCHIKRW